MSLGVRGLTHIVTAIIMNIKSIVALIMIACLSQGCASTGRVSSYPLGLNGDFNYTTLEAAQYLHSEVFVNRPLIFAHIESDTANLITTIEAGAALGNVSPYPVIVSSQYDTLYQLSLQLYDQRLFIESAESIELALKTEPNNLFMLNQYARALYWADNHRDRSHQAYRKLVGLLDDANPDSQTIYIDLWFTESYWKIGTLYLDIEEYERAVIEIGRFWLGSINNMSPVLQEQAAEFLAEAFIDLGKIPSALYFAQYALTINPNNALAKSITTRDYK